MKIVNQIIAMVIATILVGIVTVVAPLAAQSRLHEAELTLQLSDEMSEATFERSLVLQEYLDTGDSATRDRLMEVHNRLGGLIREMKGQTESPALAEVSQQYVEDTRTLVFLTREGGISDDDSVAQALAMTSAFRDDLNRMKQWSWNQLQESRKPLKVMVGVVAALMAVLLAGLGYIFFKISRRLKRLTEGLDRMRGGDFGYRIEVKGRDEFSDYSRGFNEMAMQIGESLTGLEQKVHERTRQLESSVARIEAILESVGEGLVVVDVNRRVILVNRVAVNLLHLSGREVVIGQKWPECILPIGALKDRSIETYPVCRAIRERRIQTAGIDDGIEYQGARERPFPAQVTSSPLIADGEVVGGVVVLRDITEERRIDAAKTDFVSLASHQLRTPLSAINWYTEVLMGEMRAEGSHETWIGHLAIVEDSSRRMVQLVNDLLNVSRIETGRFRVEAVPVSMGEAIDRSTKELAEQFSRRDIEFRVHSGVKDDIVRTDRQIVDLVLLNLISNSIKYSPADRRTVVDIYMRETERGDLELRVRDYGIGIPKNQQSGVFTKLFRADNAKQIDTTGNGLGLFIVRSLVESVGGSVSFESEPNQGTMFRVVFPREVSSASGGVRPLIIQT